jgi:hypothetical protein
MRRFALISSACVALSLAAASPAVRGSAIRQPFAGSDRA